MQTIICKVLIVLLLSLSFLSCKGEEIKEIESKKETPSVEFENTVRYLNNKATPFGDYLYTNTKYNKIFYEMDKQGNFHSWIHPEEMFSFNRLYFLFQYNEQVVCIGENDKNNEEIVIYDLDLNVQKRIEVGDYTPKYIYGNLLYGYCTVESTGVEVIRVIKSLNLDTLEVKNVYTYQEQEQKYIRFIVTAEGDVIVYEYLLGVNTCYYLCKDNSLIPILVTKTGFGIAYNNRGLFYLEEENADSPEKDLMLWDGEKSYLVTSIKTDDMSAELFKDGKSIIIEDKFFISIHNLAEEPYLLLHFFDTSETKKILLQNWPFTEADMARFDETFAGMYYDEGQLVEYFYSATAGMLQTNVIDIEGIAKDIRQ